MQKNDCARLGGENRNGFCFVKDTNTPIFLIDRDHPTAVATENWWQKHEGRPEEFTGMNYGAANDPFFKVNDRPIPYPFPKKSVVVRRDLDEEEGPKTIQHEFLESQYFDKGYTYLPAHACVLKKMQDFDYITLEPKDVFSVLVQVLGGELVCEI
ncbi:Uncharacterised protein [uncultured archaeon]|nr:Uncharacterised protein [uncultured archaeon]